MKFDIYCPDCQEFLEIEQLRRMVYVGGIIDTLSCPYCDNDNLNLAIEKEE